MPQCPICHTEYEALPENKICLKCSEWPSTSTSIGMEQYQKLAESSGGNFRINQPLEHDGDLEMVNQEDQSDENDDGTASEGDEDLTSKKSKVLINSLNYFLLLFIEYIKDNEKKMDDIRKELSELKNELENKIEKQPPPLATNDSSVDCPDSASSDKLDIATKTPSTPEQAESDSVSGNQSKTSPISLEPIEQEIITYYNEKPNSFGQSSLEVGITEQTISNERLGSQEKIIFQIQKRGTYWVVEVSGYFYLVINNNIKIDQFKSNYIKKVFDCYQEKDNQDYNNFKLLKPAKVLKLNQGGEFFQLEQKGTLEFYQLN